MRWNIPPKDGERHRTRRVFAWLPVYLSDGSYLWLEWCVEVEYWFDRYDGWVVIDRRMEAAP